MCTYVFLRWYTSTSTSSTRAYTDYMTDTHAHNNAQHSIRHAYARYNWFLANNYNMTPSAEKSGAGNACAPIASASIFIRR